MLDCRISISSLNELGSLRVCLEAEIAGKSYISGDQLVPPQVTIADIAVSIGGLLRGMMSRQSEFEALASASHVSSQTHPSRTQP